MQIDLVFLARIFSGPWLPRETWFSADPQLPNTSTKSKNAGTAWVSPAQRMELGGRRTASCHLVNVPNSLEASRLPPGTRRLVQWAGQSCTAFVCVNVCCQCVDSGSHPHKERIRKVSLPFLQQQSSAN